MDYDIVSCFLEIVKAAGSGALPAMGETAVRGAYLKAVGFMAFRRTAVKLAGVAPHLIPIRGHAALTPDASVPSGLRAALACG